MALVRMAQKRNEDAVIFAERATKADPTKVEYFGLLGNACNARIPEVVREVESAAPSQRQHRGVGSQYPAMQPAQSLAAGGFAQATQGVQPQPQALPGVVDDDGELGAGALRIRDVARVRDHQSGVAIARFRQDQALRDELDKAKSGLKDRKLIDRAKGILMSERGLTEDQAYQALRKLAMEQNRRLVEVAEGVITYAKLLKPSPSRS